MVVYIVTNKITGKVYIGKTKLPFEKRVLQHIKNYRDKKIKSYFYKTMRKYGHGNFSWKTLCECDSLNDLNEKEKFFIREYESTDHNKGYNISSGGDGGDCYTNNPNKEYIIKCRGNYRGDKNPFYGKKHSKETKLIMSIKAKKRKFLKLKRTDKTKELMRIKAMGENNSQNKLSVNEVRKIKKLLADNNLSQEKISKLFGVSRSTVLKIHLKKMWKGENYGTSYRRVP